MTPRERMAETGVIPYDTHPQHLLLVKEMLEETQKKVRK